MSGTLGVNYLIRDNKRLADRLLLLSAAGGETSPGTSSTQTLTSSATFPKKAESG